MSDEKKPKGRPKGSKSRVASAGEARSLIFRHGLPGLRMMCAVAAGRPIYRPLHRGSYEKIVPNLDQVLAAQRFIVSRMVPELKATEVTGSMDVHTNEPTADVRQLGRAILSVLGHGLLDITPDSPHSDSGAAPNALESLTDTA